MANEKEVSIPTVEEIKKLTLWAQVAFAARCARRVQPLFEYGWPDATIESIEIIDKAIAHVEEVVADPKTVNQKKSAINLDTVASTKLLSAVKTHPISTSVTHSVIAAARATFTACAITDRSSTAINQTVFASISSAVTKAVVSAASSAASFPSAVNAIRNDYELLFLLSKGEPDTLFTNEGDSIITNEGDQVIAGYVDPWTNDTPVPREVFGPMWPEGEPEGWPDDPRSVPKPFKLAIDPGDADKETIREVMSALSELHEVHTGYAIEFQIDGALVFARSEVYA